MAAGVSRTASMDLASDGTDLRFAVAMSAKSPARERYV